MYILYIKFFIPGRTNFSCPRRGEDEKHDVVESAESRVLPIRINHLLRSVLVPDNGRQQDGPHVLQLPIIPDLGSGPDVHHHRPPLRRQETPLHRFPVLRLVDVSENLPLALDLRR